MEYQEIEEKIINIIDDQLQKKMLSHAYFIEDNGYENIENLVRNIVKHIMIFSDELSNSLKEQICHFIDLDQCLDVKFIYPDGNTIKKEQLLSLKKLYKTTSKNAYRIYVIFQADKLNSTSANTILKFLEEPEDGIIAFLVANNRYKVIETLVSRCQILTVQFESKIELDEKDLDFLKKITTNIDFYFDFKELQENYMPDSATARKMLDTFERYFHQLLLEKIENKSELKYAEFFTNVSKNSIIKYISIFEEEKEKLLYNVNYRLWFHHLLIRFMEVIREDA